MHEASIVQSLIDLVRENVPEGSRVRKVHVRVGLLTGVSPDSMQFYFEILREGTPCEEADLAVALEPLKAECESCGRQMMLDEPLWLCPHCGGSRLRFANGDELNLSSIEVEDGENLHA